MSGIGKSIKANDIRGCEELGVVGHGHVVANRYGFFW